MVRSGDAAVVVDVVVATASAVRRRMPCHAVGCFLLKKRLTVLFIKTEWQFALSKQTKDNI